MMQRGSTPPGDGCAPSHSCVTPLADGLFVREVERFDEGFPTDVWKGTVVALHMFIVFDS
jgi:hypothetical protein